MRHSDLQRVEHDWWRRWRRFTSWLELYLPLFLSENKEYLLTLNAGEFSQHGRNCTVLNNCCQLVQSTATWLERMSLSLVNFIMIRGQMAPSQGWPEISQRQLPTLTWYPAWGWGLGKERSPWCVPPPFRGGVSLFTSVKSWPHRKLQFYLSNKSPRILSLTPTQPEGILPFLPSVPQLHGPMRWWRAWGWFILGPSIAAPAHAKFL